MQPLVTFEETAAPPLTVTLPPPVQFTTARLLANVVVVDPPEEIIVKSEADPPVKDALFVRMVMSVACNDDKFTCAPPDNCTVMAEVEPPPTLIPAPPEAISAKISVETSPMVAMVIPEPSPDV
eukprot:TRINITY_DN101142_c0_g1_i1.p2 TRINITY_DN101142_c0_g1~~TRINITY_DN101142_c0_g1_i1.p2  ORF type:complete len:124 (-),score=23.62 TRINITY_DN101142_c0_g1_i1:466-837(-)